MVLRVILGGFWEHLASQKPCENRSLFLSRLLLIYGERRRVDGRPGLVKTATDPPGAAPLSREKRDITTQGSHNDPMIA